jgi:hypothetical protein
MLYAAQFFIEEGETDRARSLLEKIIALPPDPEWEFENRRDKESARALLESLGHARISPDAT